MNAAPHIKRGDIWLANLDPTIGSEIQKTRPCVVVSPPELHDYLRTVTIVPMTTAGFPAPYRVSVQFLEKTGFILPDQLRTLDRQRLIRRLGQIDAAVLSATLRVLCDLFAE